MNNIRNFLYELVKSDVKVRNFDREHIFYSMINSLDSILSVGEKMDLFHFFMISQKSFKCLLFNDQNLYNYYHQKIDFENIYFENDLAKACANSIYYPILAYKAYKEGRFKQARNDIKLSIANIDIMIANNCLDCVNAKLEQNLNLVRLYISEKDSSAAIDMTCKIIDYLTSTNPTKHISNVPFQKIINNEDERHDVYAYYIDSLITTFLKDGFGATQELFKSLVKLNLSTNKDLPNTLKLLLNSEVYFSEEELLEGLISLNFKNIPFILQFLLIEKIKSNFNIELSSLSAYYSNFQFYTKVKKLSFSDASIV